MAGIAAYISYWHAYTVVRQYGEGGVTALLEPGTIDGLVYASSMVILHVARHRLPVPRLARWMLALGITASLAVNVAQGWSHGLVGAAAAAWPRSRWWDRTRCSPGWSGPCQQADQATHPHRTMPYHGQTSRSPAHSPVFPRYVRP